jgi:hypothetical protein
LRDIRQDLRERLASIKAARESMQDNLRQLTEQQATLEKLLEAEEALWQPVTPSLFPECEDGTLRQVLIDTLKAKDGAASLEELKDAATERGVPFGRKQPGRVIHFAMLGMAQNRLVERTADGRWELRKQSFGD